MHPRKSKKYAIHKLADRLTEILIYFIVIFSPWAFGSTEPWSIWTMNFTAYSLGVLLIIRWISGVSTKYNLNSRTKNSELSNKQNRLRLLEKTFTILLITSMGLLLIYILTSAINARASFNLETKQYSYFTDFNSNLPHSYNAKATWQIFWQYLGLIILFWSVRDWINKAEHFNGYSSLNPRLKKLLYVICLNGGILSLECIVQRLYYGDFQGKLLFLVQPTFTSDNISQFGPFAYRSNASSYLNIIWPLGIGLFIYLGRENLEYRKKRIGQNSELILIPLITLIASGPIISSARGGTFIMLSLLIISTLSLLVFKVRSRFLRSVTPLILICTLSTAYILGWEKIEPRIIDIFSGSMNTRAVIYEATINMINDYGKFGSGPGSFQTIIQFEIGDSLTVWESWAHNDYLEFYLTFGLPGSLIISLIIFTLLAKIILKFLLKNNYRLLIYFGTIALAGVSIHALVDFPFQTHSILILVCVISTLISNQNLYLNKDIN